MCTVRTDQKLAFNANITTVDTFAGYQEENPLTLSQKRVD